MAQREREMMINKHGKVRTKVAGDDEMLRTGFHNGTALEAGKIADSQPVDLFATAHRRDAPLSEQQQQQMRPQQQQQEDEDETEAAADGKNYSRVIAESEPVDLPASARGVAQANSNNDDDDPAAPAPGRQGMAAHAAGGRRLGRQA